MAFLGMLGIWANGIIINKGNYMSEEGTIVAVIFDKQNHTEQEAIAWLRKHKLKFDKTIESEDDIKFRIKPASDFKKLETMEQDGIKYIIGY